MNDTAIKDLDKVLNNIDYKSFHNNYVPTKFALKFITFIKLVNGKNPEENASPLFHYDMLDQMYLHRDNLFVVFRGGSKTSVIHEYASLYKATYGEIEGFGRVDVGMYVGDTIDNGVKSMRKNLEFRWNNSEFLQKYIPEINFTDVRWEFINIDGKRYCERGFGVSTGVRGFKEYGQRPTTLNLDDLLSDKNAESPTIIEDIKNVLYNAATYCLHPTKQLINWTGTPFNKADPLCEAIESPSWNTRIYPVCEKFPCTKEEFVGAWEDRFSYEAVLKNYTKQKGNGRLKSFYQELMLKVASEEERLVQDDDLVWYSRKQILLNKDKYNFYITTDFGIFNDTEKNSKSKNNSDFSVISVFAYNNNKDWLLVDGMRKRQKMDKTLKDLFKYVSMYKPVEVGIETSGQQGGFLSWIKEQMITKNVYFQIARKKGSTVEGFNPKVNKVLRFALFVPKIIAKKFMLPEEMKNSYYMNELLEEFRFATKNAFRSKHDDVIDTISMLNELDPYEPSEETPVTYVMDNGNNFALFEDDNDELNEKSSIIF